MGQRSDFSKPCQRAAEKSANATRCCCLVRGSQCVGMSTKKDAARLIRVGGLFSWWRYRTRTARAERSEGNQSPSATTTTAACGRNREELLGPRSDFSKPCQGAAEKSANATRCCCLARGSQRIGMSTKKDAARLIRVRSFCFGGRYRTRTGTSKGRVSP